MDFTLSREAQLFLLRTARDSIKSRLFDKLPEPSDVPADLNFKSGCFVTLHLRKRLRGCIGNFRDDINIVENVFDMARQAAFADPRFGPVSRDEFSMCEIEISVLSTMAETKPENIKTGRDGIYIINGYDRGVLLPQVAVENRWDEKQFLEQTCIKAGLPPEAYKYRDTKIYSFQALVFSEGNLLKSEG